MSKTKCDKCNKEFKYSKVMNNFPGGLEKENIICPYCGHCVMQIMTSGIISSNKLETKGDI